MLGELSQCFVEASHFFHSLPLYYQTGHGFEGMLDFILNNRKKKLYQNVISIVYLNFRSARPVGKNPPFIEAPEKTDIVSVLIM